MPQKMTKISQGFTLEGRTKWDGYITINRTVAFRRIPCSKAAFKFRFHIFSALPPSLS